MSAICERLSRFRSEILYLNDVRKGGEDDNYVPPIVYGEVKSKANPNGKTILFYNHYDVQPEELICYNSQKLYLEKTTGGIFYHV